LYGEPERAYCCPNYFAGMKALIQCWIW